jgi:drug/metabolite transporter (DMT)-like permease
MNWIRQQSPQLVKWLAISMFGLAFIFVYLSQDTTFPADAVLIVAAIVSGVAGFGMWLIYGDKVDGGPRR